MLFENGFESGKWQEKVGGVCLLPNSDSHPLRPALVRARTPTLIKATPVGWELLPSS